MSNSASQENPGGCVFATFLSVGLLKFNHRGRTSRSQRVKLPCGRVKLLSGSYSVMPAWNVLVCSVDGSQLIDERRRVRRLWRHTFVRGFPNRPWEYWLQLVIRLIRACQAVRSIDSSWCRLITGIVAKYAGRVGRESACIEGAAAVRWYGPDPEVFGRSAIRDVDRFCFYDDMVPLSYGERFSSEHCKCDLCDAYQYQ